MELKDLELPPVVTAAQGTNISTGVTCNGRYCQITTQTAGAAAGAEDSFVLTNSFIKPTSIVLVSFATASGGVPMVQATKLAAGSCTIVITNLDGAAALDAALVLNVLVLG